jgi:hypothetical protein
VPSIALELVGAKRCVVLVHGAPRVGRSDPCRSGRVQMPRGAPRVSWAPGPTPRAAAGPPRRRPCGGCRRTSS